MTRSRCWILALALCLAPACNDSRAEGVCVVVDESLGASQSSTEFDQHFVNSFGEDCGMVPEISSEKRPDGTLRIDALGTNHYSSEGIVIDLSRSAGGSISASIETQGYFDGGDEYFSWKAPRGKIVLNALDWSTLSPEHPVYVQFELTDAENPAHRHATGFIRLPR